MRLILALVLVMFVLAGKVSADEPVDLELVLLADASRSIVFLQGAYGYRDVESGRKLRYQIDADGNPLFSLRGAPLLTLLVVGCSSWPPAPQQIPSPWPRSARPGAACSCTAMSMPHSSWGKRAVPPFAREWRRG